MNKNLVNDETNKLQYISITICYSVTLELWPTCLVLFELLPLDIINFYAIVCISVPSVNPSQMRNYCS